MKTIILYLFAFCCIIGNHSFLHAQEIYDVIDSPIAESDSTSAKVTEVYTIGDSLIVVKGEMQSLVNHKVMFLPISYTANLFVEKYIKGYFIPTDSCSLRNVVLIDPATDEPTESEIFGITYWEDVKPDVTYEFYIIYYGRITMGDEYLSIISKRKDLYDFKRIHIDNSIEKALIVNRTAFPTTTVNVRKGASRDSAVICRASPSTIMVAEVNNLNQSDYCKVVILRTGEEGYVHKKYLSFGSVLPKATSGALKQLSNSGLNVRPDIEVYNNTERTINLTISGTSYKLKPHDKKTITANAGKCHILATGAGCNPYYGIEDLREGYTYSWEFIIKTSRW
ncbi:MAG: SH3 domain-containing protein [Lachnospira sp.]